MLDAVVGAIECHKRMHPRTTYAEPMDLKKIVNFFIENGDEFWKKTVK